MNDLVCLALEEKRGFESYAFVVHDRQGLYFGQHAFDIDEILYSPDKTKLDLEN